MKTLLMKPMLNLFLNLFTVQNEAKKLRHGIEYTKMLESTLGCFKRPKVWNTTRMVVYEFEMLERFLENSSFLDIPIKFLLLAKHSAW